MSDFEVFAVAIMVPAWVLGWAISGIARYRRIAKFNRVDSAYRSAALIANAKREVRK
ncbi:hypothetical protein [Xanthomonas campestris]|uniref:hypothetical protein n=1 Tax=Xanthomonas campestris TaxID=339 RepID=UPI0023780AC3|nr:hypothetical protein [Xanthomonas campestris]WDL20031.1 hypothetical protein JH285_11505 [Xanthomonas campestris pv. campestris]WDL24111.1 hypothetical protein JH268_11505 [Xanthomonas campestris pv. campestris]WDL28203.1 hypothetical protein JH276_10300 [Xanthomonas campestris pv. campestris]WDL32288.1 hypothetical protein JH297_11525 [Xanthomonas campestris pv. campestris]WDL36394.1 hypothetical protein JH255_10335 [Xanthomonas campestris pv. campestris]